MQRRAVPKGRRRTIFWRMAGLAALAFACAKSPVSPDDPAGAVAAVAKVAAAVTGQDAPMADRYEKGQYLGFDTYRYPGDSAMRAWKDAIDAPYGWVGYYLPAPCHRDSSWTGKRQALVAMGWGMAVVYVGQQTWGRTPPALSAAQRARFVRQGRSCDAGFVNAARGAAEADDAIARTAAEGFPRGTVIFLDIERMEQVPAAMRAYYTAWTDRVLADGRYRPGYYVHKYNAELVYGDVTAAFAARGVAEAPRFWVASAKDFDPSKRPSEVGHAFAGVWQGIIDVAHEVADITLPIDVNVAAWPSPSDWGAGD